MARPFSLVLLLLLQLSCGFLTTPQPTATPSPTHTSTPQPTPTPFPTSTAAPSPKIELSDIAILVPLDGYSLSVPFPYVHQVQGNIILVANEDKTLSISYSGDNMSPSESLMDIIDRYLKSLEDRGASFDVSEPAPIEIDGAEGVLVDLEGTLGEFPIRGSAIAASPDSDFVVFGMFLTKVSDGDGLWQTHKAIFEALSQNIRFVNTDGACPVSVDKTYGFTESNPIQVGGGDFEGPSRERAYLDHLLGPNGEALAYERTGSFSSGDTILDAYHITGAGIDATLYIDEYNYSPPQAPVDFTCIGEFPLSAP